MQGEKRRKPAIPTLFCAASPGFRFYKFFTQTPGILINPSPHHAVGSQHDDE
jgi:hypothetical protein